MTITGMDGTLTAALRRAPAALGIAAVTLFLAACNQVGTQTLTFWDIFWSMVWFFFLFMALMIWFTVLMDIFRRNDLSGGMKVVWLLVCFWIPLLGCLIYMLMRPKATAQDVQMMAQAEAAQKAAAGVSTADELAKLQQLKDAGTITDAQFQELKAKIIAS